MGFTKRARAAENAITAYPSRFPSFSLLIQGNAGMARTCSPLRRARLSSHSFSSPLFLLPPSIPFIPFGLLTRLVLPYQPFCRHSSVSLSPPSLFRSLVLRGNSSAPLRSLFHPLFFSLSLWLSLTHVHIDIHEFRRHIKAIWSDSGGLMEGE